MSRIENLSKVVHHRHTTRREIGKLGLASAVLGALGATGLAAKVAQAGHPGGQSTVPRCALHVKMCYSAGSVYRVPGSQRALGTMFVHNADPQSGREIILSVEEFLPGTGYWTAVRTDRFSFTGGHGGGYDAAVHGVDQGSTANALPFETASSARCPSSAGRRYRVHVGITGTADDSVTGDATTTLPIDCG